MGWRGGGGVEWEVIGDRAAGYRMCFSLSTFLLAMSNISLSKTSRCDECLQLFCGSWKLNGTVAVCEGFGPHNAFSSTAAAQISQSSRRKMGKQKRDNIALVQPLKLKGLLCQPGLTPCRAHAHKCYESIESCPRARLTIV